MALSDELLRLRTPNTSLTVYKTLPLGQVETLLARAGWTPAGPPLLPHQKRGVLAGLRQPHVLFRYEQGLGKTKMLLDLLATCRARDPTMRGVALGPSTTSTFDWVQEAKRHRPELRVIACPENPDQKRAQFLPEFLKGEWDLAVLDYISLQTLFTLRSGRAMAPNFPLLTQAAKRFSWVALDEIHLAKSRTTLRAELLGAFVEHATRRYGATGTLFNQDPSEAWMQAHLLDGGETLGKWVGAFRTLYCKRIPNRWTQYDYQFDQSKLPAFQARLEGLMLSYSQDETVELPGLHQVRPVLTMTPEQQLFYANILEGVRKQREAGELTGAWVKLRRILSGFTPTDPPVPLAESPKCAWLVRTIQQAPEPWVVFYEYTESGRAVTDALQAIGQRVGWLYSGTVDRRAMRHAWEKGEIDVLVVQNAVGAQALNLQRARRLAFFESPCSAITRSQAERRIYRIGQTREAYIYDLFFPHTVEAKVVQRALAGISLHQAVLESVQAANASP